MSFMKSFLLLITMSAACTAGVAQSVAINNDGALPHTSAALDIKSTNKGLLTPRLTTAERTAIASPAKGLLVFDTNTNSFWFHNGAAWTNLAAGGGSFSIPYAATGANSLDLFSMFNNGTGNAIFGRNDGGRAATFMNANPLNIEYNALHVETNGNGNIVNNKRGHAAMFVVDNTESVAAAVRASVNTVFGNFGAAAVFGESAGTGGFGGLFYASNPTGNGNALTAVTEGNGSALYAYVPNNRNGSAGRFQIMNAANNNAVVTVSTIGNGTAGDFMVNRVTGTSPAVKGEVNSQFSNWATAGVYGVSAGTGGWGGLFYASNVDGNGQALQAHTEGKGNALVLAHYGTNGNMIRCLANNVVVARVDRTGKAFFNGGVQSSGADVAEAFDVTGDVNSYQPGDVLVISTSKDRAVEKSAQPYSTLVAGVYATKPGVLLTEENVESNLADKVPMGVVGVIPTRVCGEGGAIKRGDMLVTSSLSGVAMKADADKVKPGQVIGKALQDFNGAAEGKINVLVNVK